MPKFPVAFGRRKSTVTSDDLSNAPLADGPSFRVLERSQVAGGKSFDGGARLTKGTTTNAVPRQHLSDLSVEDNMFADLKTNRGSGSSNTTKTASTDTSSRHSAVSTTPSSADLGGQEEWKGSNKRSPGDMPTPPIPKSSSGGFLNRAGRTFSFGGQKKHLPAIPGNIDENPLPLPPLPSQTQQEDLNRRPRGLTSSTSSTATPPKIGGQEDFSLDLGGDFGTMFTGSGFDKRASVATVRDDPSRAGLAPRSLTGNRFNQPAPIRIDHSTSVEKSPYSWTSQHSNENLLSSSPLYNSPTTDRPPPPVPRHGSPLAFKSNRPSDIMEDEDTNLLKDSLVASRFLGGNGQTNTPQSTGRYRRNEDKLSSTWTNDPIPRKKVAGDDNMFDSSLASSSRMASSYVSRPPSPPRNKVMTPAQFEKYRQDKERQEKAKESIRTSVDDADEDEDDNYEDDDDEIEKSKQAAKQRRKQEAHMTVYRQQMMKVTGEAASPSQSRPSLQFSMSTPNLPHLSVPAGAATGVSDGSDSDEEVPLAILAAHGFPNKTRPPNRLSNMASNPNMRVHGQQSPQPGRPGSSMGETAGARGSHLPAFARGLPQDPFVGAGLVSNAPRESLAFGGGAPAPSSQALPPGGLVGVIANEERSRAMRRGSPQVDTQNFSPSGSPYQGSGFDPVGGIPPQMMYGGMGGMPQMPMLTPGDQAQMQMNQQMQQFMHMQMQFMQMMASQQPGSMPQGYGLMPTPSMMDMASRQSFIGDPMMEPPRLDPRMRTMSMVQPSSASWIQPQGYAPSILAQGGGYAPSIAPSERSNVGLPGRYRPVSHAPPPPAHEHMRRVSTMSGAIGGWDEPPKVMQGKKTPPKSGNNSDDDDEEGWEAMKAKREKKRSMWKSKKGLGSELSAMIS